MTNMAITFCCVFSLYLDIRYPPINTPTPLKTGGIAPTIEAKYQVRSGC